MGAPVGRVRAEDADAGPNADVAYSVPDGAPFAVDAVGGEIRTRAELDFEQQVTQKTTAFLREIRAH